MKFPILILFLFCLPIVFAYNGWYWYSPSQLLDNEWFVFALIFIVIFAMTFYALSKTMKENIGVAVVISLVISLFISVTISQRTYFYGYVGETIGNYLLIVAIILGTIILIKTLISLIGGIGLFISLFGLWLILRSFDPYDFLPYEILDTPILPVWQFLASQLFLLLLTIAFIIILLLAYTGENDNRKEWWQNWLWGKKKKKETLADILGRRVK